MKIQKRKSRVSLKGLGEHIYTISIFSECFEQDVDYYGSDITSYGHVFSMEDCQKKCRSNSRCTHFTYVPDDFEDKAILNTCHLKYNTNGKMSVKGLVSGRASCGDDIVDTVKTTTEVISRQEREGTI